MEEAQHQFGNLNLSQSNNNKNYSKLLIDGTSGRILSKEGGDEWIAQNLMYMYQHVQGKVFNARFWNL